MNITPDTNGPGGNQIPPPDQEASDVEVAMAMAACTQEVTRGAEPLTFSDDAAAMAKARYEFAFRKNLPKVGGWAKAEPTLRRVAFYFGAFARDIAAFHHSTVISVNHAKVARSVIENECDITASAKPSGKDGLICNGLPNA